MHFRGTKALIRALGHIVSKAGLEPDPLKIEAIRDLPAPTTPNLNNYSHFLDFVIITGVLSPVIQQSPPHSRTWSRQQHPNIFNSCGPLQHTQPSLTSRLHCVFPRASLFSMRPQHRCW